MNNEEDLSVKFVEILAKKDATPLEKKIQALIKAALLSDNLLKYIQEVQRALAGVGKISSDTVKGVIEYAKAHSEAQIRDAIYIEMQDKALEREKNRLTRAEVWLLGTLAHLGLLE